MLEMAVRLCHDLPGGISLSTINLGQRWNIKLFKGTVSIKMCEVHTSHVKETSFICSLVIN